MSWVKKYILKIINFFKKFKQSKIYYQEFGEQCFGNRFLKKGFKDFIMNHY